MFPPSQELLAEGVSDLKEWRNSCSKQLEDHKRLLGLLSKAEGMIREVEAKNLGLERFLGKDGTEAPSSSGRHSKRKKIANKKFEDEEVLSDDDYLLCDDCGKEYKGDCPTHPPLFYYPHCSLPVDGSEPERAYKTLPDFLSLSSSGIKGSGLGVWTEVELPKGVVFGPFEGTVLHKEKEASKSGLSWQILKRGKPSHYIEAGEISSSNWLRFVNCATMESRQNLIAFQYKGKIYYRTYKRVPKHCELLVWYGDKYASDMNIDLTEDTLNEDVEAYLCNRCNISFASEERLQLHMQKKHKGHLSEFKHRCKFCSYSSNKLGNLKHHLLTHSGEKLHQCERCGKRFSQKGNLERHLLVHDKDRCRYKCNLCTKSFTQQGHLARHKRTHMKERPFKCTTCGAAFTAHVTLQRHERLHTGQKPYSCKFCDYKCAVYANLKTHVIFRHTGEFPHQCATCGKGFVAPSHVKKHQKKHTRRREE